MRFLNYVSLLSLILGFISPAYAVYNPNALTTKAAGYGVYGAKATGASDGTNCTSGSCVIRYSSGTWLSSVVWNSTGNYTITFIGSLFSQIPVCTIGWLQVGTTAAVCQVNDASTSSFNVNCTRNDNNQQIDTEFQLICIGK